MVISEMTFEESNNGLAFCNVDEEIVDYICDNHGVEMLKSFDERKENTGVAIFFDGDDKNKDLVVIIRSKNFDGHDQNGLVMFVVYDLYKNGEAKKGLIEILSRAYESNPDLRDAVKFNIEKCATKSIETHA